MSSPEQQQESLAQEASVDSLWGELGGLNLAGLDDWEELQYVDVEGLIEQLVRWTCWYRNITGTPTSHRHTIIAGTPSSQAHHQVLAARRSLTLLCRNHM